MEKIDISYLKSIEDQKDVIKKQIDLLEREKSEILQVMNPKLEKALNECLTSLKLYFASEGFKIINDGFLSKFTATYKDLRVEVDAINPKGDSIILGLNDEEYIIYVRPFMHKKEVRVMGSYQTKELKELAQKKSNLDSEVAELSEHKIYYNFNQKAYSDFDEVIKMIFK